MFRAWFTPGSGHRLDIFLVGCSSLESFVSIRDSRSQWIERVKVCSVLPPCPKNIAFGDGKLFPYVSVGNVSYN